MTESELEIARLRIRMEVMQALVQGLYIWMANSAPGAAQSLRTDFAALRTNAEQMTLPRLPPEYSDLLTAEYQAALDDVISVIERGIN